MRLKFAEQIAYSSKEAVRLTYELAVKCKYIQGVFVETGVAAGAQIIAMHNGAPYKMIYAFDSFEGIPLPSNRDNQMPGIKMLTETEQKCLPDPGKQALMSSGATVYTVAQFMDNMIKGQVDTTKLVTVPGWFENTIPYYASDIESIALLRLDGDLYYSTMVPLQHFFEKVRSGGYVIIDDWALPGCRAACRDYFGSIQYEPDLQFLRGNDFTIAYFKV